ncbi:SAM-dependent methyltransferase [Desulforapulum autotrophicum HRM2]|uniref:SAM-dependent methyltransferase n=1 Tax=Desulforapulum autotrophicum (strain ATCC 43914 / DSM 3382 / VKM B-1955 / HRM2) TaxID=177437 RepID=C0QAH2_DESAH|nr:SAM-dependent methyltransferase [Desulforapulum autotrophicum HRM2]
MYQPKTGYRFSIDPILLADHADPLPGDRIADLGTGCGIIPLLLSRKHPETHITGIEIQGALVDIANKNIQKNHLTDQVTILLSDIRSLVPADLGGPVDLVVTNPPYIKQGCGRINPHPQKAIARHEVEITLDELLDSATKILTFRGRFMIIFPMERLNEVMERTRHHGMGPFSLRFIHTHVNKPAKLFILTAMHNRTPLLTILPPLFLPLDTTPETGY